jgi:glycosyltransferase involved in cell wall biosynthesis
MANLLVSTVIPTFNRRTLVCRAIDSALAQTYSAQEIIVIDDGSTDGTEFALSERYGEKIRYLKQANAGVSRARNHGMSLARGAFIALLDSDDEWQGDKLDRQVAFLQSRPDYGMVLTDVQRVDSERRPIDRFYRREVIEHDGDVLTQILANPALVPASVLMRREVWEQLGGFDETLRTAEDIEFHLRVAANYSVGVIAEPLTIAMRGHAGLSEDSGSESDYVHVVEQFIARHAGRIPRPVIRGALFATYARNGRSAILSRRFGRGIGYGAKALVRVSSGRDLLTVARLASTVLQSGGVVLMRAVGLRGKRRAQPIAL